MSRIFNAAFAGVFLGFGIGSALAEMWLMSAACFIATSIGLFLFIRSCLRRIF
jgi:hypothetical protein